MTTIKQSKPYLDMVEEIEECRRQIALTNSEKRKRDLSRRYLKLKKELNIYLMYQRGAGRR